MQFQAKGRGNYLMFAAWTFSICSYLMASLRTYRFSTTEEQRDTFLQHVYFKLPRHCCDCKHYMAHEYLTCLFHLLYPKKTIMYSIVMQNYLRLPMGSICQVPPPRRWQLRMRRSTRCRRPGARRGS